MRRRILVAIVVVLAVPAALFAQNQFGIWANRTTFNSSGNVAIGMPVASNRLEVSQQTGFGVSADHFSGPNVSTEFSWMQSRGEAKLMIPTMSGDENVSGRVGSLRSDAVSAILRWHFAPGAMISPYLGVGGAYFLGGHLATLDNPGIGVSGGNIKFDNHLALVTNAGIDVRITRALAIGIDVRRASYKAKAKGNTGLALDLDPTTVALGVKLRM